MDESASRQQGRLLMRGCATGIDLNYFAPAGAADLALRHMMRNGSASRTVNRRLDNLEAVVTAEAASIEALNAEAGEISLELDTLRDFDSGTLKTLKEEGTELNHFEEWSSVTNGGGNILDGALDEGDAADEEVEGLDSSVELVPVAGGMIKGAMDFVTRQGRAFWDSFGGEAKIALGVYQVGKGLGQGYNSPDYGAAATAKALHKAGLADSQLDVDLSSSEYLVAKVIASIGVMHHSNAIIGYNGALTKTLRTSIIHPTVEQVAAKFKLSYDKAYSLCMDCAFSSGVHYYASFPEYKWVSVTVLWDPWDVYIKKPPTIRVRSSDAPLVNYGEAQEYGGRVLIQSSAATQSRPFMYASMRSHARHVYDGIAPLLDGTLTKQSLAASFYSAIQQGVTIPLVEHRRGRSLRTWTRETAVEHFSSLTAHDDFCGYSDRPYTLDITNVGTVYGAAQDATTMTHRNLVEIMNTNYGTVHTPSSTTGKNFHTIYNQATGRHANVTHRTAFEDILSQ
jgi:hypothetical protein